VEAKASLHPHFSTLNPLRGREAKETLPSGQLAVQRDKDDIRRCHIMLVDDTRHGASMIGTSMEVLYAWSLSKLVVVFGAAHQPDYWLDYHSHHRVPSLAAAVDLLIGHFRD